VERLFDVLRATGQRQRPGSKTAFNTETLSRLKDGPIGAETIATLGTGFPKAVRDAYERFSLGANVDELAYLLTHPDAAAQFKRLATARPGSNLWDSILIKLGKLAKKAPVPAGVRRAVAPYARTAKPYATAGRNAFVAAVPTMLGYGHDREQRASGGKVEGSLSRMDKALVRAQNALSDETTPLMELPDEQVANALRIAKGS
jgi:hypothetical protein